MEENERRNNARHEMEEIRTPQTRMSFLTHQRYREQLGNSENMPGGGVFPESRIAVTPSGIHAGKGPRSYRRSDESIHDEVCRKLTDDPSINASEIEVIVSDSEVVLQGKIDSRSAKRGLEDLVESVRGVRHVENRVRLEKPEDLRSKVRETFR